MIRPILHDPLFLAQKAENATEADRQVVRDLLDTLQAHRDRCVGMAANMIGKNVAIIAIFEGGAITVMLNPEIVEKSGEYEAEEGCLSLSGVRKTRRFREITVRYQDERWNRRVRRLSGFPAQIVQHEVDHLNGVLI